MSPKLMNILPVFMLAAELGNVFDSIGRTKGATKYLKLADLFDELMAMSNVHFGDVMSDFKSLEGQDRADLLTAIKAKLDLPDDKVEGFVEEGLGIVMDAVSLGERAARMVKAIKA